MKINLKPTIIELGVQESESGQDEVYIITLQQLVMSKSEVLELLSKLNEDKSCEAEL